eukprot:TRINITY_DN46107_c0_g1_i1.p1 TRINITY_DN46107_c0_g1~~TRINITY_DN46107_c0_g1_i1.p1  ORF type:complete len:250 (-),score=7.02 TRINITY_DN46107_c0_g1_i1:57-806(-)
MQRQRPTSQVALIGCCWGVVLVLMALYFVAPQTVTSHRSHESILAEKSQTKPESSVKPVSEPTTFVDITELEFEKSGNITFVLFPNAAPQTAANWKRMIETQYLVGCGFYRAEQGFCLQGGCWHVQPPREFKWPVLPLEYKIPNYERMVSMARSTDPKSATSEFSIMLHDNSQWNGPGGSTPDGYAVFMKVIKGWDLVQMIVKGPTHKSSGLNMLDHPVNIVRAEARRIPASDIKPPLTPEELAEAKVQ